MRRTRNMAMSGLPQGVCNNFSVLFIKTAIECTARIQLKILFRTRKPPVLRSTSPAAPSLAKERQPVAWYSLQWRRLRRLADQYFPLASHHRRHHRVAWIAGGAHGEMVTLLCIAIALVNSCRYTGRMQTSVYTFTVGLF